MNNQNNNVVPNTQVNPQQVVQQPVAQSQPQVAVQPVVTQPKKKSHTGLLLSLLIILALGGACFFLYQKWKQTENYYINYYSPINAKEETNLDIKSPLIQDLYNTFKTVDEEDFYGKDLNSDTFKLYIALRNISYKDYIESKCNMFDNTKMQGISCPSGYVPVAINEEVVKNELIKLYGEHHEIQLKNVQLGNSCYGGYEYIEGRKQFVLGKCTNSFASMVKTEKKLIEATTTENNITLKEKVRYYSSNTTVPDYLKDGVDVYHFRLDNNYNYVFVNKEHTEVVD